MNLRLLSTYQQQASRIKAPAQPPQRFLRINQNRTQGKLWESPQAMQFAHPAWFSHQVDAEDSFFEMIYGTAGVGTQLQLFKTPKVKQLFPPKKNRSIEDLVKILKKELAQIEYQRADKLILAGSLIGWRDGLYGMHAILSEFPWLTTQEGFTNILSPEIAIDLMVDRLIEGFGYTRPVQLIHDKMMVGYYDNVLPTELTVRYALNSLMNNSVSQAEVQRRLHQIKQFLDSSPGPTEFMNAIKYMLEGEFNRFRSIGIPKAKSYKATQFWTAKYFSYQRGWFLGTILGIALGILEVSRSCDVAKSLKTILTSKRYNAILSNAAETHDNVFLPLVLESLFGENDIWTLMERAIQALEDKRQHSSANRLRDFKEIIVEHSIKQHNTLSFVLKYLNEIIEGKVDQLPEKLW